MPLAEAGSQRWMQLAVNRRPDLLLDALRRAGAVSPLATIDWASPLESENCCEYRDRAALARRESRPCPFAHLPTSWPARGPVWDAIGRTSDGVAVFVEAKAHIPEAASPASRASPASLGLITLKSGRGSALVCTEGDGRLEPPLLPVRKPPRPSLLCSRTVNCLPSALVFLDLVNDSRWGAPRARLNGCGATRLLHAALGLPRHLESRGVFDAFLDVRQLGNGGEPRDVEFQSSSLCSSAAPCLGCRLRHRYSSRDRPRLPLARRRAVVMAGSGLRGARKRHLPQFQGALVRSRAGAVPRHCLGVRLLHFATPPRIDDESHSAAGGWARWSYCCCRSSARCGRRGQGNAPPTGGSYPITPAPAPGLTGSHQSRGNRRPVPTVRSFVCSSPQAGGVR